VQSFTYTFACERRDDGERHVIERPEKYEHYRAAQPYSLRIEVHGGEIYGEASGWLDYRLYETRPGTKGGLWTYRRLLDRDASPAASRTTSPSSTGPATTTAIAASSRAARSPRRSALQDAKRVSLGFLHWLQTEAPTEGDRSARRSCACAPTSWARPTGSRSIPTSASRAASCA
jgi:hypothetical protein